MSKVIPFDRTNDRAEGAKALRNLADRLEAGKIEVCVVSYEEEGIGYYECMAGTTAQVVFDLETTKAAIVAACLDDC